MLKLYLKNEAIIVVGSSRNGFLAVFVLILSGLQHRYYRLKPLLVESCGVLMLKLILV